MIGLLGKEWGYTDADGNKVSAFRDMFDGGGAGRFGDTFEGAPISGLLNTVGVRPAGYRARQRSKAEGASSPPAAPPAAAAAPASIFPVNRDHGYSGPGVNPVTRYDEAARFATAPIGVNPVTPYGEAARFGLLAPTANVPYTVPQDIAANESRMNEMDRLMVENALPYHLRDTYGVPTWAFHMGQN